VTRTWAVELTELFNSLAQHRELSPRDKCMSVASKTGLVSNQ